MNLTKAAIISKPALKTMLQSESGKHESDLALRLYLENGLMSISLLAFAWLLSTELEHVYLLGTMLALLIGVLALCRYLLYSISRAFEASCDWLECRLARRKVRHRLLTRRQWNVRPQASAIIKQQLHPLTLKAVPQKSSTVQSYKTQRPVDARAALRRSCAANDNSSKNSAS